MPCGVQVMRTSQSATQIQERRFLWNAQGIENHVAVKAAINRAHSLPPLRDWRTVDSHGSGRAAGLHAPRGPAGVL